MDDGGGVVYPQFPGLVYSQVIVKTVVGSGKVATPVVRGYTTGPRVPSRVDRRGRSCRKGVC